MYCVYCFLSVQLQPIQKPCLKILTNWYSHSVPVNNWRHMAAKASHMIGDLFVCLTTCIGWRQRDNQTLLYWPLCDEKPLLVGGFHTQRASNAEKPATSGRHHGCGIMGYVTDTASRSQWSRPTEVSFMRSMKISILSLKTKITGSMLTATWELQVRNKTSHFPEAPLLTHIGTWIDNFSHCFLWNVITHPYPNSWWRHQMETFSA